jgi:hypothetical protein
MDCSLLHFRRFHRVTYSIFLGRIILNIREAKADQNAYGHDIQATDSDPSTLLLGDSLGQFTVTLDIYQTTTNSDGLIGDSSVRPPASVTQRSSGER